MTKNFLLLFGWILPHILVGFVSLNISTVSMVKSQVNCGCKLRIFFVFNAFGFLSVVMNEEVLQANFLKQLFTHFQAECTLWLTGHIYGQLVAEKKMKVVCTAARKKMRDSRYCGPCKTSFMCNQSTEKKQLIEDIIDEYERGNLTKCEFVRNYRGSFHLYRNLNESYFVY